MKGFSTGFAAACLLALPCPVFAQSPPPDSSGFYLGAGGAWSTVSVEIAGYYDDDYCGLWGCSYYKDGDGGYGYTAHAGYRFMPYLAAEVNYVDPGLIRYNQGQVIVEGFPGVYKGKASLDITAWEVSLLGILPFADWWEVYLRAGVGFWQGENDQRLISTSDGSVLNGRNDADGTDFLFGLGLGFVPTPDWAFRLEFQTLTIDGEVLYTKKDASLDSVLFEVEYRF